MQFITSFLSLNGTLYVGITRTFRLFRYSHFITLFYTRYIFFPNSSTVGIKI